MKPQKSFLWLWTTLWLTSFLDGALLYILASAILTLGLKIPLSTPMADCLVVVGYSIGAWLGSRYIVKHSVVLKSQATKLSLLGVLVPFIGSTALFAYLISSILSNGGTLSPLGIGNYVLLVVVMNVAIIFVTRSYITMNGDDVPFVSAKPVI